MLSSQSIVNRRALSKCIVLYSRIFSCGDQVAWRCRVTSVFRMLYFPPLWVLNLCRDALHCARNCVFVGVNSRYVLVLPFRDSLGLCQNEGIECLSTVRRSVYMSLSCIPNFDPYRFLIQVPKDPPSLINQAYWNKHKPHS